MKALFLLLLCTVQLFAQDPTFIIAIKDSDRPKSNDPNWRIEAGEVYRFVRWMTQSEMLGGSLPTNDKTFLVARVGDVLIAERSKNFTVPEDLLAAEQKYNAQVAKLAAQSQALPPPSGGSGLSKNDRIRMLYILREEKMISSIRRGEEMSDTQLHDLYNQAMTQRRLRDIERAIRSIPPR